ncbi:MAG: hypothetical protein V1837_00010 [Candidatus Woesearchaeota archaeon]
MAWQDYLKVSRFPTGWCPGCGLGIVLRESAKAFERLSIGIHNPLLWS